MRDEVKKWLEPMARELLSRPDALAVLVATDLSRLPPNALELLGQLGGDSPLSADETDLVAVGAVVRIPLVNYLTWLDLFPARL
jgi:hypothetical protein